MSDYTFDVVAQVRDLVNSFSPENFTPRELALIVEREPILQPAAEIEGRVNIRLVNPDQQIYFKMLVKTACICNAQPYEVIQHLVFDLEESHEHLEKCLGCQRQYEIMRGRKYISPR